MRDDTLTVERAAEAVSYAGAASATLLWGLSVADAAVLVSAVIAVASFSVHLYFSWRRDRREAQAHEKKMQRSSS